MSAFSEFSTTPSANTSAGGLNIAEGCPAANVNDVIRFVLSAGKELNALVAAINTTNLMPKSGGAFTGGITRSGGGAYTYYASSSLVGGAEYVQPSGQALPTSPAEGTKVYQY